MRQLAAPLQIGKVKKVPNFISGDHDKLATTVQRNTRVLRDMGSRRSFSPGFFQAHELGCRSLGLWANKNKRHGVCKRILALKAHEGVFECMGNGASKVAAMMDDSGAKIHLVALHRTSHPEAFLKK